MIPARKALLETRDGYDVGRDPRQVSREELLAAGHKPMSAQKALRLRCLDCCAGSAQEVRLCTAVACPAWPFRTGTNVWRAPASEARREWGRRLGKKTAAGAPKAFSEKAEINTPDGSAAPPPTTLPAEPPLRRKAGSEQDFQTTGETAMDEGASP